MGIPEKWWQKKMAPTTTEKRKKGVKIEKTPRTGYHRRRRTPPQTVQNGTDTPPAVLALSVCTCPFPSMASRILCIFNNYSAPRIVQSAEIQEISQNPLHT